MITFAAQNLMVKIFLHGVKLHMEQQSISSFWMKFHKYSCPAKIETRGAVVLRYFSSKACRNDWSKTSLVFDWDLVARIQASSFLFGFYISDFLLQLDSRMQCYIVEELIFGLS